MEKTNKVIVFIHAYQLPVVGICNDFLSFFLTAHFI